MQTGDRPDVSHYTYRVSWSVEDDEFVATCLEFPSLCRLAASQVEALQGLEHLLRSTLADMAENGEHLPVPLSERQFSGNKAAPGLSALGIDMSQSSPAYPEWTDDGIKVVPCIHGHDATYRRGVGIGPGCPG